MRKCIVIAEAGVNHNGDLDLALQLVDAAAQAGADFVKFQTFFADELACNNAPKADYQKTTGNIVESHMDMLRRLELPRSFHRPIMEHCLKRGIGFLSTPFGFAAIDFLNSLDISIFKIPSGEITNLPYLRKIGAIQKDIILSTGMSTLEEVKTALEILKHAGTLPKNITLLHCTTQYPSPFDSVNLLAMLTMKEAFPDVAGVGYSDHTEGTIIPIAAVVLGAVIIEKHFTLDRSMEGPDHKISLEPHELKNMVDSIHAVGRAMGDGVKQPSPAEISNIHIIRKSIVAKQNIAKGEIFTEKNITTKRPGSYISPMYWDEIIGKASTRDYVKDDPLLEL